MAKARVKGTTVESSEEIAADGKKKGKRGRPPREGAEERSATRPREGRGEVIHVYCEPTSIAEKALFCAMGFITEIAGIPGSRQAKQALAVWIVNARHGSIFNLTLEDCSGLLGEVLPGWETSEHAIKPPILHVYASEGDDDGERDRLLFHKITDMYVNLGVPKSRQVKCALSRWLMTRLNEIKEASTANKTGQKTKG